MFTPPCNIAWVREGLCFRYHQMRVTFIRNKNVLPIESGYPAIYWVRVRVMECSQHSEYQSTLAVATI